MKQLSMVFEGRVVIASNVNAVEQHADLCLDVLRTFVDACRAHKLASFWDLSIKVPSPSYLLLPPTIPDPSVFFSSTLMHYV